MRAPRPPTQTPTIVTIVNKLRSRIYKKEVKNTKLALWAELPLLALYITFIVYDRALRRRLCAPSWLCRCLGWCAHEKCLRGLIPPSAHINGFLSAHFVPGVAAFVTEMAFACFLRSKYPCCSHSTSPFQGGAGRSTGSQVPFALANGHSFSLWFVDSWQSYHLPRSAGDGSNWYPPLGVTRDESPPLEGHMQRY